MNNPGDLALVKALAKMISLGSRPWKLGTIAGETGPVSVLHLTLNQTTVFVVKESVPLKQPHIYRAAHGSGPVPVCDGTASGLTDVKFLAELGWENSLPVLTEEVHL